MINFDANVWAVLVSALVAYVLGALWYSPVLFGNMWMKLVGMSKAELEKAKDKSNIGLLYLIGFLSTIVMAFVLEQFLGFTGAVSIADGVETAFWLWLGFIATQSLNPVLWENKSIKLYLLNNAYDFLKMMVMAAILVAWV